jgi:hypothetical protein
MPDGSVWEQVRREEDPPPCPTLRGGKEGRVPGLAPETTSGGDG